MNNRILILLLSLFAVLLSLDAQAQRKTDVVTLYNGDRVTGEIKSLFGGILELSTDSMGRLKIEWQEIARVESQYHYEFRITDGRRFFGSVDDTDRPGQFVVTDLYGTHKFEWLEVVEMRPIEDTFAERLDVYLAAGYSYTKAGSVGQITLNTDIGYETENARNALTGRTTITSTDETDTTSSRIDINRSLWTDRTKLFRVTFANYETNDELQLDYRIGAGGGIGRFFIDTHKNRFLGTSGLQVITEKVDKGDTNQDVELYLSTSYSTWKFNTPELDFSVNFSLYPSLTDSGRFRSDSSIRLRWEIIEDLFVGFSGWATTDNQAEGDQQVDYGITTELGWEY